MQVTIYSSPYLSVWGCHYDEVVKYGEMMVGPDLYCVCLFENPHSSLDTVLYSMFCALQVLVPF